MLDGCCFLFFVFKSQHILLTACLKFISLPHSLPLPIWAEPCWSQGPLSSADHVLLKNLFLFLRGGFQLFEGKHGPIPQCNLEMVSMWAWGIILRCQKILLGVFWEGLSHKKGTQKEVGSCSLDVVHIRVTSKLLQLFCQGGQPLDESNWDLHTEKQKELCPWYHCGVPETVLARALNLLLLFL
jgi:hypothetical protein